MTAVHAADVYTATDDDLRIAARNAVEHSGYTFEELVDQARRGEFETPTARMSWMAIRGLDLERFLPEHSTV